MNKGTVFISPLGTRNRRRAVFEEIAAHCPDGNYSSILYITPALFTCREAGRQFQSFVRDVLMKNIHIPFQSVTLHNLCTGLYEEQGAEGIISDRIGRLILCEVIGEKNIGYASLLADLLSKIRHYMPDRQLSSLKDEIRPHIFEEKTLSRAVDAIGRLVKYEERLSGKGLIDFQGALAKSHPLIEKNVKPEYLVLDGFIDPTPLELRLIEILIEQSFRAVILVGEDSEFLRFLQSRKFGMSKKRLKSSKQRTQAGYCTYPSMEDEVQGIARGVKGRILEGLKPSDIVVSFPLQSKYIAMLLRIFKRYGIPVSITEHNLSGTQPFPVLLDMIASMEDDYPSNEFLSFLTSPFFPGISRVAKELVVPLSYRAGIVKGRRSWLSIQESLLNGPEDDRRTPGKALLKEFRRQLKQIITTLEGLRNENNLLSFVDNFESLLHRFGLFETLEQLSSDPLGMSIFESVKAFLVDLRSAAEFTCMDREGSVDGGFYIRQLFKGIRGNIDDARGVRVVPFELAAGLESRVLFLGGMVEGDLPSRPPIDPLLPESVKKTLGLPFLEYYLHRQERDFKRILNTSYEDPSLSYPEAERDKVFLPSPFLDWGGQHIPPAFNVSTEEEILIREGAVNRKDCSEILWNGKVTLDRRSRGIIANRYGKGSFLRVTEIDAYRICPLRFYIERFLGLEREEIPRFEVEARFWGRLAHRTMEYLFREGDIPPERLEEGLLQGLEKSLRDFPLGAFWASVARQIFRRLVPALEKLEGGIRREGYHPYLFEESLQTSVSNLNLKGKVDRIDRRDAGAEEGRVKSESRTETRGTIQPATGEKHQRTVILLDYKTGLPDLESLQLPLYARMWQEGHKEQVEKTGFYSLRHGNIDWLPRRTGMEVYMEKALQDALDIIQKIRSGIFTPLPFRDGVCRSCYHSPVCKGAK